MDNSSSLKDIILKLCGKIQDANKETIEILRSQPLCNLKMVQRKAKNIKDPNPLSSMMSTIATKYPISVDLEKARKVGIPKEMIHKDDSHQSGRSMCKLAAIEWYLKKAQLPSEDVTKAIDVLYHNKRKDAETYYSFNWSEAKVVPGTTFINRRVINTQEPMVDVPNSKKTDYIMACLMPDYVLNYDQLNLTLLKELKTIRDLKLVSKMTIQSQLRILINSLNPKPRCIPCLDGKPVEVNRMRHAFAAGNYEIRVKIDNIIKPKDYEPILRSLGEALFLILNGDENADTQKLFFYLNNATFEDQKITHIIDREHSYEGTFINYLLVFMARPVHISSSIEGFKFNPLKGQVTTEFARTSEGVRYTRYIGEEDVQISGGGLKGIFKRLNTSINGINMNKVDRNTLVRAIASIASYCRFQYYRAKGKNLRMVKRYMFDYYMDNPWIVVGVTKDQWRLVMNHHNIGIIKFSDEIEMSPLMKEHGIIVRNTIKYKNGNEIHVEKPNKSPTFPTSLRIEGSAFSDFVAPKERLRRKVMFYLANYTYLMTKIEKHDYCWANKSIMEGVPSAVRKAVALSAQNVLIMSKGKGIHPTIISFQYCFSGLHTSMVSLEPVSSFQWFECYSIDLTMREGSVFFDHDQTLMMFGRVIEGPTGNDIENFLPTILPGYSFLDYQDSEVDFKPVIYLREKEEKIPHGTLFNISVFGKTFLVKRDITAQASLRQTIARNIQSIKAEDTFMRFLSISATKRKAEEIDEGPSTSKSSRMRVELNEEDPFEFTQFDDFDDEFEDLD